jgi:hypothetical protein
MALDVKAGVAAAVTSCGVVIHLVDVDTGGRCLSRCGNQERSSSCETGDDNGAHVHLRPRASYDIVPASSKVRFLIFSVVIMLAATTLITTKGKLGRAKEAVDIHAGVSDANP